MGLFFQGKRPKKGEIFRDPQPIAFFSFAHSNEGECEWRNQHRPSKDTWIRPVQSRTSSMILTNDYQRTITRCSLGMCILEDATERHTRHARAGDARARAADDRGACSDGSSDSWLDVLMDDKSEKVKAVRRRALGIIRFSC